MYVCEGEREKYSDTEFNKCAESPNFSNHPLSVLLDQYTLCKNEIYSNLKADFIHTFTS